MKWPDPIVCLLILTAVVAAFIAGRSTTRPAPPAAPRQSQLPSSSAHSPEAVAVQPAKLSPETDSRSAEPLSNGTEPVALVLRITGLKPEASNVFIAVFDSADTFPKSELSCQTQIVSAAAGELEHRLDVEAGRELAIAVFQDLDGTRRLTRNIFGIPAEPYGFSNNARGITGPPSFSSAAVIVSQTNRILTIHVH